MPGCLSYSAGQEHNLPSFYDRRLGEVEIAAVHFPIAAGRQIQHWDTGGLITDLYAAWVDADPAGLMLSQREVEAVRFVPFEE
ncbi:MAG TPA: hypothetical protein PKE04_22375, partial [Clostridia bacterium]|nr:hypothetical protein [Clostridia bacterium]